MENVKEKVKNDAYISDLSIGDTYSKGFELFKNNVVLLLGVVFVSVLASIPGNFLSNSDNGLLNLMGTAYNFLVTTPLSVGAAWVALKAARGQDAEIGNMFDVFQRNYVNVALAMFLTGLAVGIGFLLLIIPGIFLAVRLSFVSYLVIDQDMAAIDAMKTSWAMTSSHAMTIFLMALVAIGLGILGVIALVVGIFVAIPIIGAAFAIFYHSVVARDGIPSIA